MRHINFFPRSEYAAIVDTLNENGHHILEMDTNGLDDIGEIYKKMISVLPIGIGLELNEKKINWDAFLDSVGQGIIEQPEHLVAFIWLGSESLLRKKLSDFFSMLDILKDLSIWLYDIEPPKYHFNTFILGEGECYS